MGTYLSERGFWKRELRESRQRGMLGGCLLHGEVVGRGGGGLGMEEVGGIGGGTWDELAVGYIGISLWCDDVLVLVMAREASDGTLER